MITSNTLDQAGQIFVIGVITSVFSLFLIFEWPRTTVNGTLIKLKIEELPHWSILGLLLPKILFYYLNEEVEKICLFTFVCCPELGVESLQNQNALIHTVTQSFYIWAEACCSLFKAPQPPDTETESPWHIKLKIISILMVPHCPWVLVKCGRTEILNSKINWIVGSLFLEVFREK